MREQMGKWNLSTEESIIVRALNKIFLQNKSLGTVGKAKLKVMKEWDNRKVRGNAWKLEWMKQHRDANVDKGHIIQRYIHYTEVWRLQADSSHLCFCWGKCSFLESRSGGAEHLLGSPGIRKTRVRAGHPQQKWHSISRAPTKCSQGSMETAPAAR